MQLHTPDSIGQYQEIYILRYFFGGKLIAFIRDDEGVTIIGSSDMNESEDLQKQISTYQQIPENTNTTVHTERVYKLPASTDPVIVNIPSVFTA